MTNPPCYLALILFTALSLAGCSLSSTHNRVHVSPTGEVRDTGCSSQCVAKVNAGNDQEKCLKFSEGMAQACNQFQGKKLPQGSFTDDEP